MRGVSLVALLVCHTVEEPRAQEYIDGLAQKLVSNVVDNLFDWDVEELPHEHSYLDSMFLGKTMQRARHSSVLLPSGALPARATLEHAKSTMPYPAPKAHLAHASKSRTLHKRNAQETSNMPARSVDPATLDELVLVEDADQQAQRAEMLAHQKAELERTLAGLPMLSGLQGKAMMVEKSDIPSKAEVRRAMPQHVLTRDTRKSLAYAAASVIQSAVVLAVGTLIPLKLAALPLWVAYALVGGTVWTGMWVIAHECGHGAFSDNRALQDTVGYILHTILLVPYFSWQHSHAIHHSNTNHITKGETHVPSVVGAREGIETLGGEKKLNMAQYMGKNIYGAFHLLVKLGLGWPVYLLTGQTGGPAYGTSNHFIPDKPFSKALWKGKAEKVWQSTIGIVAMLGLLAALASKFGIMSVMALYVAPLLVTNAWLVLYTWLQHTDTDVPHLTADEFSYMRGAFLTVDRPYGRIFDWFHHSIGSTHVAHHIDCTIPHYHAREATDAIKKAFPKAYLYDPTPIHEAIWRVAKECTAVKLQPKGGRYTWVPNGA